MNKILVATDFSTYSENALDYAISFANAVGITEIHILNANPLPQMPTDSFVSLSQVMLEDSAKSLLDLKISLENREDTKNIYFTTQSSVEDPVSAIRNYADKIHPDLLIMGSKGRTGVESILLGSVSASVIENISTPALIIPKENAFIQPKSIVLCLDLKSMPTYDSFSFIKNLCIVFNTKLHLLHVSTDGKVTDGEINEKKKILEYFHGIQLQFHIITSTMIEAGIEMFIQDMAPDISVVLHRKHSFFEKIWKASTSKRIAKHTPIPLLTLYEK